ncbi:THO complex subunit 1 transcription elongation factor-domain-containing protein [Powellomyces hirtus]|nr:THO complex subunit 1 transcription elongation factor-domain-containing protein [Powellomyces hirtus]
MTALSKREPSVSLNDLGVRNCTEALLEVLARTATAKAQLREQSMRESVREVLSVDPATFGALATAFTSVLFNIVEEDEHKQEHLFSRIYDLLDVALYCTEAGIQDPTLPFSMIEDLLDVLTISGTDKVVDYLESRSDRLTVAIDPSKGKGLVLLRLCNEILRRLSKTKNTIISGRILMFMANVYPLSERSGVNLRGEFNIKNGTHFEGEDDMNMDAMEVDSKDVTPKVDPFYKTFWNLQKYIANPVLLCQPENFEVVKKGMELVFDKFDEVSKETSSHQIKSKDDIHNMGDRKRKHPRTEEGGDNIIPATKKTVVPHGKVESFFPKFLTRPDLFELEIRDPHFRRQILAQFSIILQYLSLLSQDEKDKALKAIAENKGAISNKAIQQSYTLTAEQEQWVRTARGRAYGSSEATVPSGKQFAKNLSTVITHERNWIEWKNRSCQTFEMAKVAVEQGSKRPKLQGSDTVKRQNWLGSDDMTALWAKGDAAEAIMQDSSRRNILPNLVDLIGQVDEQLDEHGNLTGGIEAEYGLHTDMKFSWRMYRTAMRHHIYLYQSRPSDEQVENKAPGKGLLMEWRKEKLRVKNPIPNGTGTATGTTEANADDTAPSTPQGAESPSKRQKCDDTSVPTTPRVRSPPPTTEPSTPIIKDTETSLSMDAQDAVSEELPEAPVDNALVEEMKDAPVET